jgi:hypothetical protein
LRELFFKKSFEEFLNLMTFGVPLREKLRVGLYVPAFFIPQKSGTKKSSTAIPHAKSRKQQI